MKNLVYMTTNVINGKQDIGSHSTHNINDGYLGSGTIIKNAIKKYGRKNFKREILIECETPNDARDLEEAYISKYKTIIPNGYNISPTGGTTRLGKHSEKTIQILRDKNKGSNNPWFGKKHTEETKEKIRQINTGRPCSNLEQLKSEEVRDKISETLKEKFRTGEIKNGMTGRSHSAESIEKIQVAARKQRGPRGPYKKRVK